MRIGIIGFGFMGRAHFGCWAQIPQVEIAAICDANPDAAKNLDKTVGNIACLPHAINTTNVGFYTSVDKMLAGQQLDAVSITLPTHLHAGLSCRLLKAGVHVLCEKPMALTIRQCEQMIEAAEQTGKKLMIAHCLRFWPEYVHTRDIIRNRPYGKVYTARFQRFSSRPSWSSDNWLLDINKSGGMLFDLHIHDADYIQSVFGMPRAVRSRDLSDDDSINHIDTHYLYESDILVSAEASWLASRSFGFRMNYELLTEHASIVYDSSRSPVYRVFPDDGPAFTPPISPKDAYFHEIEYFSNWIGGAVEKECITPQETMDSIRLIEAEIESCQSGKTVDLREFTKRTSK